MDFILQTKLTKNEWESIETPVSKEELEILQLMIDGYENPNIKINKNKTFLQMLKLDGGGAVAENSRQNIEKMDVYIFHEFFKKTIDQLFLNIPHFSRTPYPAIIQDWISKNIPKLSSIKMKKADLIRIEQVCKSIHKNISTFFDLTLISKKASSKNTSLNKKDTASNADFSKLPFEYILLKLFQQYIYYSSYEIELEREGKLSLSTGKQNSSYVLYTFMQMKKLSIHSINPYVISLFDMMIDHFSKNDLFETKCRKVVFHADQYIEKNEYLLKYQDLVLYSHQKQLFSIFSTNQPPFQSSRTSNKANLPSQATEKPSKLVLYTAPTGTGKTLSPIGLSKQYKIIFVCVARHVGLALAKSAISVGKKVAFAFGCETANDIRLHYFSATNYSINKKSGGIGKVDNSCGENVEIMICDVKSYLVAMYYMLAFFQESNIITYWDEPTITMDYENHPLHETIHRNWAENRISKVVLSSATLPTQEEIYQTISDFQIKFEDSEIYHISSYDCKKSIRVMNKENQTVLPHLLFKERDVLLNSIEYCEKNKTLLRYFDLGKVVEYLKETIPKVEDRFLPETYFENISSITMESVKLYYLFLLRHFHDEEPLKMVEETQDQSIITSENTSYHGLLLTTSDAHTLTDGPTIYIVEDVDKIADFYIRQTNLPITVMEEIMKMMHENEKNISKMTILEKNLEDALGKDTQKEKKMAKMGGEEDAGFQNKDISRLKIELENIRSLIKTVKLNAKYVPNTKQHQQLWAPSENMAAFSPYIEESIVKRIMALESNEKEDETDTVTFLNKKILLLLGIGVFTNKTHNVQYMEIMKQLASEQKLYLILAQSDYIYGTNYQFCHAFIGKDLTETMTPQKIIQAMGRVGRGKLQQDYSVRFRDNSLLEKLFLPVNTSVEATNMNRLFSS